jgi:hypothetical protein
MSASDRDFWNDRFGSDSQRFFHGTKADLKPGDLIEPGRRPNFGKRERTTWVYLSSQSTTDEVPVGAAAGRTGEALPQGGQDATRAAIVRNHLVARLWLDELSQ